MRFVLFQEQWRMPLRRDEISKKVIDSQRGAFKIVFEEAQKILRGTFDMELFKLPTRALACTTMPEVPWEGQKSGESGDAERRRGGRR